MLVERWIRFNTSQVRSNQSRLDKRSPPCNSRLKRNRLSFEGLETRTLFSVVLSVAAGGIYPVPISRGGVLYLGDGELTVYNEVSIAGANWTAYDLSTPPGIIVNSLVNKNQGVFEFEMESLRHLPGGTRITLDLTDSGYKSVDDPDPIGSEPTPNRINVFGYSGDGRVTPEDYSGGGTLIGQIVTEAGNSPRKYHMDVTGVVEQIANMGSSYLGFRFEAATDSVFESFGKQATLTSEECPVPIFSEPEPPEEDVRILIPPTVKDSGGPGWDKMSEGLRNSVVRLRDAVVAVGGTVSANSGWRSQQRQEHLYHIAENYTALKARARPQEIKVGEIPQFKVRQPPTPVELACDAAITKVNQEVLDHSIKDPTPKDGVSKNSAHTRGEAIDLSYSGVSPVKFVALATEAGLWRRLWDVHRKEAEQHHWEERPANADELIKAAEKKRATKIKGNSPIDILLTDSQGRRIGYDPASQTDVNDFGDLASYSGHGSEPQEIMLELGAILDGDYKVTGIGTGEGPYAITRTFYIPEETHEGGEIYSPYLEDILLTGVAQLGVELPVLEFDLIAPDPGDVDRDGDLDLFDLQSLSLAIQAGDQSDKFNIYRDDTVDSEDVRAWVTDLKRTWFGDSDLDGVFDSSDLIRAFQRGSYESGLAAKWDEGDWNADGFFSSEDLVVAFQDGGYEKGRWSLT